MLASKAARARPSHWLLGSAVPESPVEWRFTHFSRIPDAPVTLRA